MVEGSFSLELDYISNDYIEAMVHTVNKDRL